ncbi:hypothetical protein HDU98_000325, partial [Podochytrium sp. JEL0797]
AYLCLYDMLSEIPSLLTNGKTNCKEDIWNFSAEVPTNSHARLIEEGCVKVADPSKLGLSYADNARFGELLVAPEDLIWGRGIDDWFSTAFFTSNFWYEMRSTFAFQPWHSAIEFKRYCLRFMHEVPKLFNMGGIWRSPFNQYDSIIAPTEKWLRDQGVIFENNTNVTSLDFEVEAEERYIQLYTFTQHLFVSLLIVSFGTRSVYRISLKRDGISETIDVSKTDRVFTTLGSMTAASSIGTTNTPCPPVLQQVAQQDPTWALWSDIAKRQPDFGHPEAFYKDINASMFQSFSVTCYTSTFFDRYIAWSGNQPGTGALVTFKNSKWGMSIVVPHQPHFANQPENVQVFWAYGLFPNEVGNYVKKPMKECTGREMMEEVLHFLAFESDMDAILDDCVVIPSMLPYTMAQFVKRSKGDRPAVVPKHASNFAFLGQFVEVPDDTVFTVEYSVHCAQIAVFKLCGVERAVTPMNKKWREPGTLLTACRAMLT